MILQALKEYYDRKPDLARYGWENKEIRFVITLDPQGNPILLEDTEEIVLKKKRSRLFLVPQTVKHSSNIAANLLWGNPEYALGVKIKGKSERVRDQFSAFINAIADLHIDSDAGIVSVQTFLNQDNPAKLLEKYGAIWKSVTDSGANITFRLQGDKELICNRSAVKQAIDHASEGEGQTIRCLLTGEPDVLAETHTAIKNVWGAQSSGANIVSFNADAFKSFGKKQGANAPIGKAAAFAYTTALNHLLGKDSSQRIQMGDASTVFWSEKSSEFEDQFAMFFSEPHKNNADQYTQAVKALLESPITGAIQRDHQDTGSFYVLGLAPNASRISIRFWIVAPLAEMQDNIRQHFRDLEIVCPKYEKPIYSIFRLLISTAARGDAKYIAPNLEGETMRAILEGLPYPAMLLQTVIRRIKAEQSLKNPKTSKPVPHISYIRAALIKACINRNCRFKKKSKQEELAVSLDPNNMNIGYRLGRLFAVLEKIQQAANPGINSTIRDRYYGAASGTPSVVFGTLIKLSKHHLAKLKDGLRVHFEKTLQEIFGGINGTIAFPPHLSLEDQGRFAVGYYHQMQPKIID